MTDLTDNNRHSIVDRFVQKGIANKQSAIQDNRREFRIVQPDYVEGERKGSFEKLHPSTKLIFNTLKVANQLSDTWAQDDFLKLLVALHPDADPETIRKARAGLERSLAPSKNFLKGVVEAKDGPAYEGLTKVTLIPEAATAVKELVAIIDGFCANDPEVIEYGRQQAYEITHSPETFAALYAKAFEGSNLAVRDDNLDKRLVEIVANAGERATAGSVRDQYAELSGRNVSVEIMRVWLGNLVTNGQLLAETKPKAKLKQHPAVHYSLPDNTPPTGQ